MAGKEEGMVATWEQRKAIGRVAKRLAKKFKVHLYSTCCGAVEIYAGPPCFTVGPKKNFPTGFYEEAGGYIPLVRFHPRTSRGRRRLIGALPEINARLARVSRASGLNLPVGVGILPPPY